MPRAARKPAFTPVTFDLDGIPPDDARAADLNRRFYAGREASAAARAEANQARKKISMSAAAYDAERRQEGMKGVRPTAHRLSKGDVVAAALRDFKKADRDLNPQYEARQRQRDNPLGHMLGRGLIDQDMYDAGRDFRRAYETYLIGGGGPIDLMDSIRGDWDGGAALAHLDAMDRLGWYLKALGDTEYDRRNRRQIMIAVCCNGQSIRDVVGTGGRACSTAMNMLIIALQRIVRAQETLSAERVLTQAEQ